MTRAFHDGTCLVELAELRDASLLGQTVGASLGLRGQAPEAQVEALVDFLGPRELLLVLDNCEHLIDGCALLAGRLLRACPDLRILSTSREPPAVGGETVVQVPPLAMPDADRPILPEGLGQYEAVNLFVDRAQASLPTFTVTEQNCAEVVALCSGLEGIPLALELAAVRLRALSPAEIVDRLVLQPHLF